jgi:hypothetical protein
MLNLMTNIDPIRARIIQLESAPFFVEEEWEKVFVDLNHLKQYGRLFDTRRRCETARLNQSAAIERIVEAQYEMA